MNKEGNASFIIRIQKAGKELNIIFRCIIGQLINAFLYGFVVGFNNSFNANSQNSQSTLSFQQNWIIGSLISEIFLFIYMMVAIKRAANHLINVNTPLSGDTSDTTNEDGGANIMYGMAIVSLFIVLVIVVVVIINKINFTNYAK